MNGGLNEIYNMNKKIQHCCEWMTLFLEDPRVAIIYLPYFRKYIIPLLKKSTHLSYVREGFSIDYCPWCAKKLPKSLTDEWFDILEKEYNLDNLWSKEQAKLVPEEFKTDEWWKKRGL